MKEPQITKLKKYIFEFLVTLSAFQQIKHHLDILRTKTKIFQRYFMLFIVFEDKTDLPLNLTIVLIKARIYVCSAKLFSFLAFKHNLSFENWKYFEV